MLRSALVFLLFAAPIAHAEGSISPNNLFFISPSKNCNEVHYDAVIEDCRFGDAPVRYYWREFEDGPDVQSEVLFYEELAYGIEVERLSDTKITVRLKQLPDRVIEAELRAREAGCDLFTRVGVANGRVAERDAGPSNQARWARLHHVYVSITERAFNPIPRVDFIDIHGVADEEEEALVERVVDSEHGREMGDPHPMTRRPNEPEDVFATPQRRECARLRPPRGPSA